MKIKYLALLFFSCNVYSQNLVLNPSFEEYYYIPNGICEMGMSPVKNWELVGFGKFNYYNKNASTINFSVPENNSGIHQPYSGNAYIGLSSFHWNGSCNFMRGKLKEPLKKGMIYKVTFYVQRSSAPFFEYALFGAKFSSDSNLLGTDFTFYQDIIEPKKIRADIENNSLNFIVSDSCWTPIEGLYKARGNEKYIFLGGLFYHSDIDSKIKRYLKIQFNDRKRMKFYAKNQDILRLTSFGTLNSVCNECDFYLIDDVCVELLIGTSPPN